MRRVDEDAIYFFHLSFNNTLFLSCMELVRIHTAVLTFCLILFTHSSAGQILPFRTYTSEQGFIADAVTSFCQDSQGYLWIGTGEGLNMYDGTSVHTLTVADGLALNHTTHIAESHREPGKMLIGTWGGGVSIWKGGKFRTAILDSTIASNTILDVDEDYEGRLWCVTSNGLYRIVDEHVVRIPGTEDARVVFIAPDSLVWIGMDRNVIVYSAPSDSVVQRIPLSARGNVVTMHRSRNGNVWITTTDSLLIRLAGNVEVERNTIPFGVVSAIAEDADGVLWLATENGLLRCWSEGSGSSLLRYTVENGLQSNRVSACLVDHEGTLWVGSRDATALQQLADRNVFSFSLGETPQSYNNTKAVTDKHGHIWSITQAGLWETWNEGEAIWQHYLHKRAFARGGSMLTIVCDRRGRLWVDTGREIECYEVVPTPRRQSQLRLVTTLRPGIDLPEAQRFFFVVDSRNNVWISILDRGVYKLDLSQRRGSAKQFSTANGLPSNDIRAMQEDERGRMWLGAVAEGIVLIAIENDAVIRRYTATDGLAEDLIRAIVHDGFGRTWVGTRRKGISVYDGKEFRTLSVEHGLSSASVWALAVDIISKSVWAGTSQGVHQLDMQKVVMGRPLAFLQGKAVTSLGTHEGRFLWFVTNDALTVYEYGTAAAPIPSPRVHITRLTVSGQPQSLRSGQEFPHDRNLFTFEYVGVSFRDPKAVQYQWKISGLEDDWQPVSPERAVTYASLPPGSYTFHVRATMSDGTVVGTPDSLSFTIVPPFWVRWWFILVSSLAAAGVIVLVVRLRERRLLAIEHLRGRIARDLHDEIGSNLSSIAMASDLLKRHQGLGEKERAKLSEISSVALNTVRDMKDIVWLIRPGHDSLDDLFLRMKDTAAAVLEGCRYSLRFPNESAGRRVDLEWRQHVYLIFKEALTNIAKHACATNVSISVAVDDDILAITIEDDGKGFDPASATNGSGLKNMRDRADILKAQFSVDSSPSGGTRIMLKTRIR